MEVLAFLFWFGWRRWCRLCLFNRSVGSSSTPPTYKDLPGWRLESPGSTLISGRPAGPQSTKKNVSGAAASGEKGLGEDFSGRKPVR